MALFSMRHLARSGIRLPLLRTQFARSFWRGSKGWRQNDMVEKLVQQLENQGVKIEIVEDENQPIFERTYEVHPHSMEVIKVWGRQILILKMLNDLYFLAEAKLTLHESGLLASLYKHGPMDTREQ